MSAPHERIKKLLSKRRMNQIQFAKLLNITPARLNNYLTGKAETNYTILVKMAELLETSTDYILGYKENYLSQKRVPTHYEVTGLAVSDKLSSLANKDGTINIKDTLSGKVVAVVKVFSAD